MEEKWILHNFNNEVEEIPQIIFVNKKTIIAPSPKKKGKVIIRKLHEMIDPTSIVGSRNKS